MTTESGDLDPQGILLEVATLIAERQSVSSVFAAFAERILELADFDFASLLTGDEGQGLFLSVGFYPRPLVQAESARTYSPRDVHARYLASFEGGISYRTSEAERRASMLLRNGGFERVWSTAITDGDLVVGIVTVAREQIRDFTDQELDFLRRAARLLGSAVRDELRVQAAEREAKRSRLLSELSVRMHDDMPVPAIFEEVQETLRQTLPMDALFLRAPGERGPTLASQELAADTAAAELRPLVSPLGRATRLVRSDVPGAVGERMEAAGIEHLLAAPLCRDSAEAGIIVLGRRSRLFSDTECDYTDVVAALLGQALAARERLERDRRELHEQRTLSWLLAAAAHETDPRQLSHAFALQLQSLVEEPVVGFGFLDANGTVTFDLPGGETLQVPMAQSNVDDGRDQWVHESIPGDYAGRDFLRELGVQSFVVTAARVGGSTLGYLVVGSRAAGYRFDEGVLGLLQLVAQLTGPAMQHAREAQAVERERALLQLTLGSLSEGIMLLDNDLNVAYHNDFGSHITHSIRQSAETQGRAEFMLPRDVASQLRTAAETRTAAGGRWHGRINGEERWLDYQFLPLEHSEYRLVCVVRDATEEVQRETEQERHREELERTGRLAALGGLIGGVAHELNNPLTAIMGLAELLVESLEDGPERDDLVAMRREAERARKIVQDLLFMARPAPVERQPFTVDSLLGHIERVRQNSWLRAGIDVRIEAADRGALLYGSEDRMTQVLLNLITNAEEAVVGSADPRITVRVATDVTGATIEVEDNGEGIDEETRDRIFEPFFTTREGTGTGLGLSVSHGIVQAHGGRIEVDSTPGEGTCFRVALPGGDGQESSQTSLPVAGGIRRVLVIDDEHAVRTVCQRLVRSMGHECDVATDPDDAMAVLSQRRYDLILCDYRLASAQADVVVEAIAAIDPWQARQVVIATGAAGDEGVQELARRYGLQLLPKPYGAEELSQLLGAQEAA